MSETKARTADPETSHGAAAAQAEDRLRASQARVLAMFRLYGDLTDQQLLNYLHDAEKAAGYVRVMSPSGARSRRSELCRPNEDRMQQLRTAWYHDHGVHNAAHCDPIAPACEAAIDKAHREAAAGWARNTLRIEGFRSPLWDTGGRVRSVAGFPMVVWGVAR